MKGRSNINQLQSSNPEQGHLNVDSPNSLADIGTPQPTLDFIFFSVFYISLRMATQNKYQPSVAAGTPRLQYLTARLIQNGRQGQERI